jgi:hypothetical protein
MPQVFIILVAKSEHWPGEILRVGMGISKTLSFIKYVNRKENKLLFFSHFQ